MSRIDPSFTPPACPPPADEHEHHVQPGDTLWAVAQKLRDQGDPRGHWEIIKDVQQRNGIKDPNLIYPGQVLRLPPAPPKKNPVAAKEPSPFGPQPAVAQFPAAPRVVKAPPPAIEPPKPEPSGGIIHGALSEVALRQLEDLGPGGSGEISVLLRGGEEAQLATRVKANVSVGTDGKVSVTLGGGVGVHVGVKGQQGVSVYAREMVDVAGTYKFPSKEAAASFLASLVESPPLAVLRAGVPSVVEGSLSAEAGLGAQLSDVFSMGASGSLKVGFKADLEKGTLTLEGEAESKVNGGIKTPFSGGKFSAPLADGSLKATCRLTLKLSEADKAIFADGKVTEQELSDLIKRQEKTAKREVEVKVTATLGRAVEGEAKLVIPVSSFPKSPAAVAALCFDGSAKWAINTYRLDDSPSVGVDLAGVAGFELKTKFRHLLTHHEGIGPDQVAAELARTAPPPLPVHYQHRAAR